MITKTQAAAFAALFVAAAALLETCAPVPAPVVIEEVAAPIEAAAAAADTDTDQPAPVSVEVAP